VHPSDLAGGFSDLEMTWLLYCADAATAYDCIYESTTSALGCSWGHANICRRGGVTRVILLKLVFCNVFFKCVNLLGEFYCDLCTV